ncbi:DUF1361 domain-containing protein [Paenibacillus sp. URB8-2]|uniref:DUF1361 domain-containing protein n=1 Tax=Paenibacillus sp. URB8-2 TaxID=2741301 RepID=UPI0015BB8DEA|nr:DUF1361 domain-containing protein [Paenibacillus sp. URB8-2]BCG57134.1 hypothetical protein PUR_05590 [Paenibacillus sp. URB8-2]
MKELNYPKVFLLLAGLTLATLAVYGIVSLRTDDYYKFLIWNLFLAWLPFLFSLAAHALHKRNSSSLLLFPLGAAWLVFFPNAPYIMTDLLHLTIRSGIYIVNGVVQSRFWYDLTMLLLFTWTAWLTGFFSLYQFQTVIWRKSGLVVSWLFVLAACALGGYGVLLGRVYRLNSWDVLTDRHRLYQLMLDSVNRQSIFFSLFIAFVLLVIYMTLYSLLNARGSRGGARWPR